MTTTTTTEKKIGALIDELVEVSRNREFFSHYGTHGDGNQAKFDAEIKRVKRELKDRIRAKLSQARNEN